MKIGNGDAMVAYIRERGYASYSSLKKLRDGDAPGYSSAFHLDFGTELHSRFLEGTQINVMSPESEALLDKMQAALSRDKVVKLLMNKAKFEVEFKKPYAGITCLGFIDILPPAQLIGDLKTTATTSRKAFIDSMDFLQAAMYMEVNKREDFYYVGISKVTCEVFTFRTSAYPQRLKQARDEFKDLTKFLKGKL
jgi:hypothetical protein